MNASIITRLREQILRESSIDAKRDWLEAVTSEGPPLYNYRGNHVLSVVGTAWYLANEIDVDIDIVTIAAWLHDISKPGIGGPDNHGEESAKIAASILKDEGVDSDIIKRITYAIRMHVGLIRDEPLDTLEAQVLWEADKLVKIGVIGFLHYVINGLFLKPGMNLFDIYTQLEQFIPLAEKIAASMVTPPAKRLAAERLQVIKDIVLSLKQELYPAGGE